MEKPKKQFPTTLLEASRYFHDPDTCVETVAKLRWTDGPTCPRCESKEYSYLTTRRLWKCKACKKQYSVKVGTIFEASPIPLDKWMVAVWLLSSCKNGISSYELGRAIGVSQKGAWFMLQRIRLAMQTGSFEKYADKFDGAIEVDETYVGGKARNMHTNRRKERGISKSNFAGKVGVVGFLERGGRVHLTVIDSTRKEPLQREVRRAVKPGATVYTDALASYKGLDNHYVHNVIDHAEKYAEGHVHTNGLENFWSLLKRGINGTYISVRPFHLFRYLDEQAFRYNSREETDAERFVGVLAGVSGKRVTWKEVTGKDRSREPKPPQPPKRRPRSFPMGPF